MLNKRDIRQFVAYFFVGGVSAIVEWICFFFLSLFEINYFLSTCFSFLFSTTTNFFLGRRWAFKSQDYQRKKTTEGFLVFIVSGIGLLLNLLLMYMFVNWLKVETPIYKTFCKILCTGIVFIWNFLIRKFFIYKNNY